MEYVSEALDTFYYTRDGSLYRQTAGSDDKQRIASDIYRVVKIYDSGEIYYIRKEEEKINLTDYVNDSKADSDAAMTAPDYPEYPEPPDYPYWCFTIPTKNMKPPLTIIIPNTRNTRLPVNGLPKNMKQRKQHTVRKSKGIISVKIEGKFNDQDQIYTLLF